METIDKFIEKEFARFSCTQCSDIYWQLIATSFNTMTIKKQCVQGLRREASIYINIKNIMQYILQVKTGRVYKEYMNNIFFYEIVPNIFDQNCTRVFENSYAKHTYLYRHDANCPRCLYSSLFLSASGQQSPISRTTVRRLRGIDVYTPSKP